MMGELRPATLLRTSFATFAGLGCGRAASAAPVPIVLLSLLANKIV
jgi:hypothetical protein